MATYLSPGVYVEEIATGPKPIAGLPTSVGALIGTTERGPVLDPTRLTGWNDYLARFGGSIAGSYTAEAAFGFFENGGTALWVTRADNAALSRWRVRDGANAASFFIDAESPGGWSAGLDVAVSRETGGGAGTTYAAAITGPGTSVNLTNGRTEVVQVATTAGATPGLLVVIDDTTTNGPVEATIEAVGTGTLTLATPSSGPGRTMQINRDPRVSGRIEAGAATLPLAAGAGFQVGDLVLATPPAGNPVAAVVESLSSIAPGTVLTLSTPFGSDVPGLDFAQRTLRVAAQILAPQGAPESVPLNRIANTYGLVGGDLVRLFTAAGASAPWSANTFQFAFPVEAGVGEIVALLGVAPYRAAISLTIPAGATPAALNQLLSPFNFVPELAKLTLAKAGGATSDFTRTDTGWTAPAAGADGDYIEATVTPTGAQGFDARRGLVVTAARAPVAGDYVDFGGPPDVGLQRITAVLQPDGTPADVYVLKFGAAFPANPPLPGGPVGAPKWPLMAWQPTLVQTLRFGITVAHAPSTAAPPVSESYTGLSLNPAHPRYYLADDVINDVSRLIRVTARTAGTALTSVDSLPAAVAQAQVGSSGALTVDRIRAALEQLERASEPALLAAPDALLLGDDLTISAAYGALIRHAEEFRRFAVIDLPERDDDVDLLEWRMLHLASTHAAAYAPFVRILNPRPGPGARTLDVPPSGFVMGVFARTDNERGVWKAPANERVNGAVELAQAYTQRRQDLLNPGGVNLIRAFPGRGLRVWGARNVTDDTTWRYVNVRRLFLMLENSIDAGTQWVVFEPNDATTWLRVRVSVENFLNQIWRAGGLAGATPEQAYRVRCGLGSTMTETDIELGLLIVFRVSHKRLAE
jgi:phage tail sheath protein FI